MLLEFSCSNYKAIKEKIVFSMVAGSDKSHQEELYEFDDYRVSRITSVYGANGAGKSTLIDAVGYLGFLVRECVKFQEGDKIPRTPHKLSAEKPTAFDIQFVVDGIRYAYGFSMNDVEFLDEYLYHFPSGRQAKIFEREGTKFSYGIKYKKELSQLESKTKSNKLFLTTAEAWCSLKEIIHPFRFFKEELIVHGIGPDNWFEYSAEQIRTNSGMKQILVVFMQKIGIPIKDIQVKIENRQLTTQDMPLELLNKVQMLTGMGSLQTIEVKFVYKDYILNIDLINIVVPEGSLLNYAITEGKEKEALWLIENGIDINAFDGLELMTAIKKNNNIIAKKLIDEGIVINSREMKDNPLVSAIRFSNAFLVEELMKNYRNLIVTYSNEYVRNCSVLDIAERTKNEKIINIVKKYLV